MHKDLGHYCDIQQQCGVCGSNPEACTHRGRAEAAVRQREVVRLPAAQELGGEELAEKGARMFEHAHLDVALVEQLVAHPPSSSAVEQAPLARPRGQFTVIIALGRVPQQRFVLLALVELVIVQLAPSSSAVTVAQIHSGTTIQPVYCFQMSPSGGRPTCMWQTLGVRGTYLWPCPNCLERTVSTENASIIHHFPPRAVSPRLLGAAIQYVRAMALSSASAPLPNTVIHDEGTREHDEKRRKMSHGEMTQVQRCSVWAQSKPSGGVSFFLPWSFALSMCTAASSVRLRRAGWSPLVHVIPDWRQWGGERMSRVCLCAPLSERPPLNSSSLPSVQETWRSAFSGNDAAVHITHSNSVHRQ